VFVRKSLCHPKISIHATTHLITEMISSCHKNVRMVLVANVNKCAHWSLTCCTAGHSNTRCISSPISFIVQCSQILLIRGILGLACRPQRLVNMLTQGGECMCRVGVECPDEIASLITRCLSERPRKRPTAAEAATVLSKYCESPMR
jgi:hypothetical protein